MSDPTSAPVSMPVGATPTFTRAVASPASLAEITEANRAAAVSAARRRDAEPASARIWRYLKRTAAVGVVAALAGGGVVAASQDAEARVKYTPPLAAQRGPVTVTDGRVICEDSFHVTVPVKTTRVDAQGFHVAAVWVQEHRFGRARLLGWARSKDATVNVVGCIDPARIDGGHGPVYVIKEDVVDGRTRPVRVLFHKKSGTYRVAK